MGAKAFWAESFLSDELGECCGACSALSLPLINDLQKLDIKMDKDTQVIDFKYRPSIANPRVGGSIPPLGTIYKAISIA